MCDNCTLIGETYRPNAEFDEAAYTRSVNRFHCPICNAGDCRPNVTAGLAYSQWMFECDVCGVTGTKSQIMNSALYAARIDPRTCAICGGAIRTYARRMSGDWWMTPSHVWIWKCTGCTFVGKLADFDAQARQIKTMPDFEHAPIF